MSKFPYPHLFEPLQLRGALLRNRIFASATGYRNATHDSVFPMEASYYYGRKAMGGAASVSSGEYIVDSEFGRGGPFHICIDNPLAAIPIGKIAYAIARFGALPTAELQHAGIYANRELAVLGGGARGEAYGPVEMELEGRIIKEMPEAMIERVIEKYALAAVRAKNCGFGMILVHAGHGWLLHQFLSSNINCRKDKWGGSDIENRARLTVSVCDAIRKAVGLAMPIEIRISSSECYDGGYGIEEGIAFAKQLEGHVDLIHCSAGVHEVVDGFIAMAPTMFLGDGCNVKYAREIKKHVKTPVATVGAIGEPEMMEEIIASGSADVVELARSLIADPDLPNKIRSGREDDIKWCLRCLHCFSCQMKYGAKYCAVNPESPFEHETWYESRLPSAKKRVLVVGGGIGGMEAALTCARRGHEVILCEKSGELGGSIRCERSVPFKKKLDMYLETQAKAINKSNIDLRMNTEVTPEYARSVGADVIFAALGARPVKPPIPGIDGENAVSAEEVYLDSDRAGDCSVILGAGLVGLELAVYLALKGKKAVIVEMMDKYNDGGNILHAQGLMAEIKRHGIELNFNTRAKEINKDGVMCEYPDGERLIEADTVIYAVGQKPLREEAMALCFCAREFHMVGDCVTPKNIAAATSTAYNLAMNVGR